MTKTTEAIYDGEVLKPAEPLNLPPRIKVKITLEVIENALDSEARKRALLIALDKTQGVWANRPDIDEAYRKLEEDWEKWNNELKSLSIQPS